MPWQDYIPDDDTADHKLDQDYDTPFSEPHDIYSRSRLDHPSTDTGLDEHELYDQGLPGAA